MIISLPSAAMVLACSAAYTDLAWGRIPNWLTIPFLFIGLWFSTAQLGLVPGLLFSLKGMGTGLACLMVPFILGGAGGGDVKLLGAMGALLGCCGVFWTFLYAALAGGIYSMAVLMAKKNYGVVLNLADDIRQLARGRNPGPYQENTGRRTIPYSLPVLAGYLAYTAAGGLV
ncbi:MAG: prepilin peptidase [Desulfobacter sp.]|nr:MAG: prepilin peptidase [Desulfobacter sp.]